MMLLHKNYQKDNPLLNNISLPNEQWKKHPNFSKYYISSLGRVWSEHKQKIMQPFKQNSGYYQIQIVDDNGKSTRFLLHRLVALVWIPNIFSKPYVNHKDGVKTNNDVSNLEWVTNSENITHARVTGLNPYNNPTLNKKLSGKKQSYSKFFGVGWDNARKKWRSSVTYKGNHINKKDLIPK